ncbi:MAG: hypothetical protein O2798_03705 [Chloroflexi bacterium]|nr:hypothetical protein [Chloroflexota bacterium]
MLPFLQKIRNLFTGTQGSESGSGEQAEKRDEANRAMDAMKNRR